VPSPPEKRDTGSGKGWGGGSQTDCKLTTWRGANAVFHKSMVAEDTASGKKAKTDENGAGPKRTKVGKPKPQNATSNAKNSKNLGGDSGKRAMDLGSNGGRDHLQGKKTHPPLGRKEDTCYPICNERTSNDQETQHTTLQPKNRKSKTLKEGRRG